MLVWADENSQFFEPMPQAKPTVTNPDAEDATSLQAVGTGSTGITCQFGRFGET